ncbi:hypothetical protein NVP1177O_20 [Vibrio phage 1.177.O._10N.286.45.E10]|nr:hypothetical protein NVP1177O_20 [Vibrio phage 1.177.O._10N.286.45.E10]
MQKSISIQEYQTQDDPSDCWGWCCTGGNDCNCNLCEYDYIDEVE